MSLLARPMTYEELQQMPDDGNRYELINGELIVSPAPIPVHQQISGRLYLLLGNHVNAHGLGAVYYAPVDLQLASYSTVQPDLLYIRQDRLAIIPAKGPIEDAPDLVVEILSPSSATMDRVRKAAVYAEAGVLEYWLVDPATRTVDAYRLDSRAWVPIEPDADGRVTSIVLPGVTVDPSSLFTGLIS